MRHLAILLLFLASASVAPCSAVRFRCGIFSFLGNDRACRASCWVTGQKTGIHNQWISVQYVCVDDVITDKKFSFVLFAAESILHQCLLSTVPVSSKAPAMTLATVTAPRRTWTSARAWRGSWEGWISSTTSNSSLG